MRPTSSHRTMPFRSATLVLLCASAVGGCVSAHTHKQTLDELDALKKQSAQQQEQLTGMRESLDLEAAQRKAAEEQAGSLAKEREDLQVQSEQLTGELATVRSQIMDLEQKHASGSASAREEIEKLQQQAASMEAKAAQIENDREQLRQEQARLAETLDQEWAAKESKDAEIKRLTRTQEELSKSLQDEISKGNITIQQVRDRLTINLVDRVLFDSGQAEVKPAGQTVLKQVSDLLNTVTDKRIRIEGHTDNVPISVKLRSRYKTNWELSTARATAVVRYLIDQGGVDPRNLSAVGHADTQPVAPNDTDEGRAANRRIEIVLYPKDIQEIADQVETGTVVSP
ncbi:OmpA family protein [Nitrospira sp. BLG_2]|uniref:OmpA family protein n=1 Tax=Nitrospira sp. BLG_2 TaxID=3397507 RepID=UPI003B9D8A72